MVIGDWCLVSGVWLGWAQQAVPLRRLGYREIEAGHCRPLFAVGKAVVAVGEGVDLGAAGLGRGGGHAAEDFAERGAVVGGDPIGEAEKGRVKNGLFVD